MTLFKNAVHDLNQQVKKLQHNAESRLPLDLESMKLIHTANAFPSALDLQKKTATLTAHIEDMDQKNEQLQAIIREREDSSVAANIEQLDKVEEFASDVQSILPALKQVKKSLVQNKAEQKKLHEKIQEVQQKIPEIALFIKSKVSKEKIQEIRNKLSN